MTDWDSVYRNATAETPPPQGWPEEVRVISMDGLALLGLDRKLRLYVDGVRVRTGVALSFWQGAAAIITVVGIVIAGAVGLIEIYEFFTGLEK